MFKTLISDCSNAIKKHLSVFYNYQFALILRSSLLTKNKDKNFT